MTRAAFVLALVLALTGIAPPPGRAAEVTVEVGYIALKDDARYRADAYGGIALRTVGRPLPGAQVGLADAAAIGRVSGLDVGLRVAEGDDAAALAATVAGWAREGDVHFVLADLPADALLAVADAVAELPVLLLNVSADDDRLRAADCRANVAHVVPSQAMLVDALMQFLVTRNWTRILALVGESAEDKAMAAALERAAKRFGARIVEERPFALTHDPRRREESNVALMTADTEADVVFVADTSDEFARYVPYRTVKPRPVVGSAGLTPVAWHWSFDRYGAPQVQHRFEALAMPQRMNGAAWSAWVAMKAVTQAAMRTGPGDFAAMRDFILGDTMNLDGSKGAAMGFRPWDHQLRQPILLATADAVIATAPFEPFLHRTNTLDTLGVDEPETQCQLPRR